MANMAISYQPSQSIESKRMLYDLIRDPSKYELWFERYAGGLIFRIGYGKTVVTGEEAHIRKAIHVVHSVERIASPGSYLVDTIPILQYLPEWLAPFKKEGRQLHEAELKFFRTLINDVRAEREAGVMAPSFTNTWLEEQDAYGLTEDEAAYVIGTLFEAGSGTTASAMMSFMLAMTLYPQWQEVITDSRSTFPSGLQEADYSQRMWEEVDRVCGDRMPDFDDVPDLPVCRAVIKEVLRWRPVTAGGECFTQVPWPFRGKCREGADGWGMKAYLTSQQRTTFTTGFSSRREPTFTPINGKTPGIRFCPCLAVCC